MFRLLKSGLPEDPVFPADLEGLGYFINDEDEIRMISNPRAYFSFLLTKNDRHNTLHREAMNFCLRGEILKRLHNIGMETVCLPLGTEETEPHIPILVSSNISEKKRVIILFFEHTQDLGVFAYRVIGGRGGINAGSAVNFVKFIQSLKNTNVGDSPGIILANLGQLRWWRRGKRAVTHTSWFSLPQTSAVSGAHRFDVLKNTVLDNRSTSEHVAYIFNHVVPNLLAPDAMLEVIGVSVGAVDVVDFLNKPHNWAVIEPRLTALALIATFHRVSDISNPWFADWLRKRGRAYVISSKPASTPLAPSNGNTYTDPDDNTIIISDNYGCPVYSLGEPYYSELLLPKGYKTILKWFQEVVAGGEEYENPEVIIEKNSQTEEDSRGEINWEEPQDTEVTVGGLDDEEHTSKEPEGRHARADEIKVEQTEILVPEVGELNVVEVIAKDPSIQGIKDTEYESIVDSNEQIWVQKMKNDSRIPEELKKPDIKDERVYETEASARDPSSYKLDVKGQRAEQSMLGDLNADDLKERVNKKEILGKKSTNVQDIKVSCSSCPEAEAEKEGANKQNARDAAPESMTKFFDLAAEEIPKSVGYADPDVEPYKGDPSQGAKANNDNDHTAQVIRNKHAEGTQLNGEEVMTTSSDTK